jgi:hypothetical protein
METVKTEGQSKDQVPAIQYQNVHSTRPTKAQLYRLLTAVKHYIRLHPEMYNQDSFCGTACCIGGWMFTLVTGLKPWTVTGSAVSEFANWCLTGEDDALPWLLTTKTTVENRHMWPVDISRKYLDAGDDMRKRAEAGCEAVDRWMAEQGIGPEV